MTQKFAGASRRERRADAREAAPKEPPRRSDDAAERRQRRLRQGAFGLVVALVLAVGGYLAFGDFSGQRGQTSTVGAISVQASMAGFTPTELRVKAGASVTLDFWTQDSSGHLDGGVHTLISEKLGLHEELPGADAVADSRKLVVFTAPTTPGEYEIVCDTCCGGRENPTMRGKIVVEA